MADMAKKEPIDIERMIMQARYELSLMAGQPVVAENPKVMDYEKRISDLLKATEVLLESNRDLGERLAAESARLKELESRLADQKKLEEENKSLRGELEQLRRALFGKHSEKGSNPSSSGRNKTKREAEIEYIKNGSRKPESKPAESADDEDDDDGVDEDTTPGSPASQGQPTVQRQKEQRDTSKRPDKYNTMHADLVVEHRCDLEALKKMGLEYIRDARPTRQIDRISMIREDIYYGVWVRDKDGNEFTIFIPREKDSGKCTLFDEDKYARPRIVKHTSATPSMLSDLIVNRFQYAISTGREMFRLRNEKMYMCPQSILNWLSAGARELTGPLNEIRGILLKEGSAIYCDETWVDVRVRCNDGRMHYRKRHMWVIVNLKEKLCYYLYGRRKRKVIMDFLGDFKGTVMTDAYVAYDYLDKLEGCTHVCCWAHARRIYVSARDDFKDLNAGEFITLISLLYKIELDIRLGDYTENEVLKIRQTQAIPILMELYHRATGLLEKYDKKQVHLSSKLVQALNYMLNHWKELVGYANLGNVQIDNNSCERAVRPFTNLRKSIGGFSSAAGARIAATYLTFIETCKLKMKPPLDFFRKFFELTQIGKSANEALTEALLC